MADRGAARERIFEQVDAERDYQDTRWGPAFDSKNNANDWVAYITRYAGQAPAFPVDPAKFRTSMIKVAALAVAAIEALEAGVEMQPAHLPAKPTSG